jgi:alcohol dehydrogenase
VPREGGTTGWPEMLTGPGSIRHLPGLIEDGHWRRVLLVCGKRSFEASGASDVFPELVRTAEIARFDDFVSNTDARDVHRGLEFVRDSAPEVVVGVGGGSTLDMAKLLCAFHDVEGEDDLFGRIRAGSVEPRKSGLVLVPTTSGSGSEATHFAVVYIDDEKYSVAHPTLRADAVVLDPALSLSASRYQKATSGIDAVCQSIESLWAVGATSTSRRFARRALRYLLPAIEPFTNAGGEVAAGAMCRGSHLAGRAIDISKTTAPHALSYAITNRYGVSHGHAVALLLGAVLEIQTVAPTEALRPNVDEDDHREALRTVLSLFEASDGGEARRSFDRLLRSVGLATRLSEVGVAEPDVAGLVEAVNTQRLRNNPIELSREDLQDVLLRAL